MKFLRELCLVLTEIWRFLINLVTMRDYVCYPLSAAGNKFSRPYLIQVLSLEFVRLSAWNTHSSISFFGMEICHVICVFLWKSHRFSIKNRTFAPKCQINVNTEQV